MRTFTAYSSTIFLYNSELWTLTETLEKQINAFQRKLLRRVIDIRWPKVVNNEKLRELTKTEEWSKIIQKRRLTWLGHLMRLSADTPASQALKESLKEVNIKVGRPKLTWIKVIEKDLELTNFHLNVNKGTTEERIKHILKGPDG